MPPRTRQISADDPRNKARIPITVKDNPGEPKKEDSGFGTALKRVASKVGNAIKKEYKRETDPTAAKNLANVLKKAVAKK